MPIIKNTFYGNEFLDSLEKSLVKNVLHSADLLANDIKEETPVLTGRLKSSINPVGRIERKISGKGIGSIKTAVATDVEYGPAVEFGRPDQPNREPRLMFTLGAEKSFDKIEKFLAKNLPKNLTFR